MRLASRYGVKKAEKKPLRPAQSQKRQPGRESQMKPRPQSTLVQPGSGKLEGKIAIITGGDSGIGRAVALIFSREGAAVVISYLNEHHDAAETQRLVKAQGGQSLLIYGDVGRRRHCETIVKKTIREFGRVDILVNNAAEQHVREDFLKISDLQLKRTFHTNIFSFFYMCQAVLPHLQPGSTIVNTTSVTAYRGSPHLIDYASTKGAIVAFTRSLAGTLVKKKIRVNGVAPGPIWTPLIPATFKAKEVRTFGSDVPMERAGEPREVAPCFLFLASDDSSYMTGQVLHPNGGEIING